MKKLICLLLLVALFVSFECFAYAYITLEEYGAKARGEAESAKYGKLQVFSEMADGQIFIDGTAYPKNSVKLDKLMPGRYLVQLKRIGYEAVVFSKLAEVKANQQTTIAVDENGAESLYERNNPNENMQIQKYQTESVRSGLNRNDLFNNNVPKNQIYLGLQNQVYKISSPLVFQGYNVGIRYFLSDALSPYLGWEYSSTNYNFGQYQFPVIMTNISLGMSNKFKQSNRLNLFALIGASYENLSWSWTVSNVNINVSGQGFGYELVLGSEITNEENNYSNYFFALKYSYCRIPVVETASQPNYPNITGSDVVNLENISFQVGFLF